ncbi:calmodulin-binding protein 60 D-like [Hibiscus syriacus]|uniref:calmodulin-binding protein 60 D-like n=1 Tax=Hibiscus syriacus TaxID=106335 RepID=UPI001922F7C0|nr:calmodulin-binding protein 60 D-like [Hibiscus syriacus]
MDSLQRQTPVNPRFGSIMTVLTHYGRPVVDSYSNEDVYKKHYPPALNDEVWRLEKIEKDGSFLKRLNTAGILTVEDFLRLVVRISKSYEIFWHVNKMEALLDHAKTCVLSGKLYVYYTDDSRTSGVVFNNIYDFLDSCGSYGNHILNAIKNFIRAPNEVDLDGILCNANTPVNMRKIVLTHYGRPVMDAYCNEDGCFSILRVKFVSEEVERALAKLAPPTLNGRSSPKRLDGPDGSSLQLHFRSRLSLSIFTAGKKNAGIEEF